MKRYCKTILVTGILLFAMNILPQISFAQDPPGGPTDPDAPIDGGVSLLVAAGVGYGIKRVRDHKREKNKANII